MDAFSSPFSWLGLPVQRMLCAVLVLAAVGLGWYLTSEQAILRPVLRHGVIELEAPWSATRAQALFNGLTSAHLIDEVRRQISWDFLFLVIYPLALSVSCGLLARALGDNFYLIGTAISWGVLMGCPVDAGENFAMLRILGGAKSEFWPHLATVCCSIKFTLAGGGVLFSVIGCLTLVTRCVCRAL